MLRILIRNQGKSLQVITARSRELPNERKALNRKAKDIFRSLPYNFSHWCPIKWGRFFICLFALTDLWKLNIRYDRYALFLWWATGAKPPWLPRHYVRRASDQLWRAISFVMNEICHDPQEKEPPKWPACREDGRVYHAAIWDRIKVGCRELPITAACHIFFVNRIGTADPCG